MSKYVTCDKCGHDFEITDNFGEIRRGDITVQYFYCTECMAKYHVLTINPAMRKLIEQRIAIQNKISKGRKSMIPVGTAHKLQHELNRVIAQQKKLRPSLKKIGKEILDRDELEEKSEDVQTSK